MGSQDLPATALVSLKPFGRGALKRSVSLRLALSHRLHLLILCARLSLPLSVFDARSPSLQLWTRSLSLCIHHAGGPAAFLTVHRLDCACQVGRCPPGSWGCRLGGQPSWEPTGATTGQAGAMSRHDLGHLARPGDRRRNELQDRVARFSK